MSSVGGVAFVVALSSERYVEPWLQGPVSFIAPIVSLFFVYLFGAKSLIPALAIGIAVRQSIYAEFSSVAMYFLRDLLIGIAAAFACRYLKTEKTCGPDLDDVGFDSLLRAIPDVLLVLDRTGDCLRVINSNDEQNDWPIGSLVGRNIQGILPKGEAEKSLQAIQDVVDSGTACSLEAMNIPIDDVSKYFAVRIVPFRMSGKSAVLWASRDITEFKEAQLRHRDSDELLRNLIRLQERERKLISCEIHDGVLQQIIVSHMMAQLVESKVSDYNDEDITENMNTLKVTLSEAIDEGRNLIQELRPIMVDEQNVVDAIGYLVKEESNRGLMRLTFDCEGDFDELSPLLEGNIFRITQEALTNARRHSKAKAVEVKLSVATNAIYLKITDDGIGFDTAKIDETSFGLKSITRRAQLFGGAAIIESCPGNGTQIHVELPVEGANGFMAS